MWRVVHLEGDVTMSDENEIDCSELPLVFQLDERKRKREVFLSLVILPLLMTLNAPILVFLMIGISTIEHVVKNAKPLLPLLIQDMHHMITQIGPFIYAPAIGPLVFGIAYFLLRRDDWGKTRFLITLESVSRTNAHESVTARWEHLTKVSENLTRLTFRDGTQLSLLFVKPQGISLGNLRRIATLLPPGNPLSTAIRRSEEAKARIPLVIGITGILGTAVPILVVDRNALIETGAFHLLLIILLGSVIVALWWAYKRFV
jgi:hypothetical protein